MMTLEHPLLRRGTYVPPKMSKKMVYGLSPPETHYDVADSFEHEKDLSKNKS